MSESSATAPACDETVIDCDSPLELIKETGLKMISQGCDWDTISNKFRGHWMLDEKTPEHDVMNFLENAWREHNKPVSSITPACLPADEVEQCTISKAYTFEGVDLPSPYELIENQIFRWEMKGEKNPHRVLHYVCDACIVVGMGTYQSGKESVILRWRASDGRIIEKTYPRHMITNRKDLLEINADGFNFTEVTALEVIKYLSSVIINDNHKPEVERKIKRYLPTDHNGWHDGSFVVGNQTYPTSGPQYVNSLCEDPENISCHLRKAGTLERWVEGVKGVLSEPVIRFDLYSSMSAPLLRPLGLDSGTKNRSGPTSTGKTTGIDLAASTMGNPDRIKWTGNTTSNAIERYLEEMNDLGTFLDELTFQTQKDRNSFINDLKYQISMNKGKHRMNGKTMKNHRPREWRTILSTTMESAFFRDEDNDGGQARVINVTRVARNMKKEIETFEDIVMPKEGVTEGNYGHFIGLYMEKVIPLAKSGELSRMYQKHLLLYRSNDSKIDRIGKNMLAVKSLAGEIVEKVFNDIGIDNMNPIEIVKEIGTEYISSLPQPQHIRALEALVSRLDIENHQGREIFKVSGKEAVISPEFVRRVFEGRFDYNSILKAWKENGLSVCEGSRNTARRALNGVTLHHVVLDIVGVKKATNGAIVIKSTEDIERLESLLSIPAPKPKVSIVHQQREN
jgi:hypothetical protein